ncbi:MFS transporter [Nocardia neocaledoniensis]|uniref:MFS transporter n=1 Tax=Nocardia neocaledoniensis TaxID=236511 RepID=UPI001FC8FA03|nr:MFS transporter [Nocardia neocaledoniensis]
MTPATIDRELRLARAAVFGAFTLNGFLLALWVVHIPAITDRAGVSPSLLGMFVLLLAGAAIVGMRAAGPAADRFGSRTLVAVAATAISVTVIGPGLATGPVALGLALACFGLGNGALDVSMNTQAVHVERAYRRPIMSAFHAMFSGGGFAGALVGAATQRAGWSPALTLTCAGAVGLLVTALLVPHLVAHHQHADPSTPEFPERRAPQGESRSGCPGEPGDDTATADHLTPTRPADTAPNHDAPTADRLAHIRPAEDYAGTPSSARRDVGARGHAAAADRAAPETPSSSAARTRREQHRDTARARKVLSLGVIAFVLLLAEGVAGDWSALQARAHLGVSEGDAALAFGAFSATMTLGRFGADRVSGAIGPVAILRYGSLLAAAGLAVVIASPWLPLTLLGWAMCGLGLAGGVPQIFTAAGNLGGSTAATDMSRVFTIGYLGLLAGPALIGWLTALIPLTAALVVPLVLTLASAAAAPMVARRP